MADVRQKEMRLTHKTKISEVITAAVMIIFGAVMCCGSVFFLFWSLDRHTGWRLVSAVLFWISAGLMFYALVHVSIQALTRSIRCRSVDFDRSMITVNWSNGTSDTFLLPQHIEGFQSFGEREQAVLLKNETTRFGITNRDFKEEQSVVDDCFNTTFPTVLVDRQGNIVGVGRYTETPPKGLQRVSVFKKGNGEPPLSP